VEPRAAARLCLRHPLRNVFFGFSFEVLAQLIIQFLVRPRPAKQRPQPQGNREQPMLRSHAPALLHSYLRATIGSTRIALRAGIYDASKAIPPKQSETTTKVAGSVRGTLNSSVERNRARTKAITSPNAMPENASI